MLLSVDKSPVFPISLGGAGIGSCNEAIFFQGPVTEKQAVETVLFALENGVNLIDTSPFYGNSEQKIGMALREYGKHSSYILSTKTGTHPVFKGYSRDNILRSIDNSLKTLQADYLDIVHIHDPSGTDFTNLMKNGGIESLLKLKEEKILHNIGLGVRDHHQWIDQAPGGATLFLFIKRLRVSVAFAESVRGRNSDNTLIEEVLGWKPSISLMAGIERTYKWIKEQWN